MEARAALAFAMIAVALSILALVRARPPVAESEVLLRDSEVIDDQPLPARAARPGAASPAAAMQRMSGHLSATWYGAKAGNPALVTYELVELEESAEEVSGRVRKGRVLDPDRRLAPALESMRQANGTGNAPAFERAYRQALDACNTCHRTHEVPVEITVPDAPPAGNRRWAP